ncbi:MAG TPA: RHS repeat domain-containing protein [Flavobacterium sp.]|uniref:RHS repeat domain-containing protein n=1 Tax=Flavobacterium sp. TaxID=239 RepID=UPI002DB5E9C0|nr:RHS repeat domain-containing protein [Flavobacterium sp.]HEU4788962.1 RHS repeat domain-containing protein [Flavobacterium sp.]
MKINLKTPIKLLLCFFYLTQSMITVAQSTISTVAPQLTLPSPTAFSMIKYTDAPINISGGRPDVTVPIYTISEPGITVPVNYNYGAGGIKVDEVASSYGLGWNLTAGGSITRVVRGIMDESARPKRKTDFDDMSVLIGAASIPDIGTLRVAAGKGTDYGCEYFGIRGYNKYNGGATSEDLEPDVFYFNFNGYSGKFMFQNGLYSGDGAPVFFPKRDDIKISKVFSTDSLYPNRADIRRIIKEWVLTTPDGIQYYFGQNNLREINFNFIYNTEPVTDRKEEVTGWFLTRIYNPVTKEEVTFTYSQHNYSYKYTTDEFYARAETNYDPCFKDAKLTMLSLQSNIGIAGVKTYVLSEINSSKIKISFKGTANREDVDKYDVLTSETYDNANVIDQIEILDKWHNKIVKKFDLNYSYFISSNQISSYLTTYGTSNDYKRLRLNSISEKNINSEALPPYVFTYYDESTSLTLPRRLSFARDNWGYYNGALGNVRLLSTCNLPADRSSNTNLAKAFMLRTVQYPTGGTHSFEYGYNAGLRLDKVSIKDINTNTLIENKYAYDQGTLLNISNDHSFRDLGQIADVTVIAENTYVSYCETAIPTSDPAYAPFGYYNNTKYMQANSSFVPPNTGTTYNPFIVLSSAPILSTQVANYASPIYGYVSVTNLENNVPKGRKEYGFNRPSYLSAVDKYPTIPEENSLYGKPTYEKWYDANNTLLKSEIYEYQENTDSRRVPGVVFSKSNCWLNTTGTSITPPYTGDILFYRFYDLTSKSYLLKKKTITEYFGGQTLVNTEDYTYTSNNINDLPTQISRTDASGSIVAETKKYSSQLNGSSVPLSNLYTANRLQELIETKTTKDVNTISSAKKEFNVFSAGPTMPSIISSSKGTNALESELQFLFYDEKGNPLEFIKTNDDFRTVMVWGYNKQYPIAEIKSKSTTYAFFSSYATTLQNLSNLDKDAVSEANLRTELNKLRVTFPNDMITTYTYDPNVGITSVTDPKGYTMYYTYDLFGRLEFVKDADGNLLSKNEYHYKN